MQAENLGTARARLQALEKSARARGFELKVVQTPVAVEKLGISTATGYYVNDRIIPVGRHLRDLRD